MFWRASGRQSGELAHEAAKVDIVARSAAFGPLGDIDRFAIGLAGGGDVTFGLGDVADVFERDGEVAEGLGVFAVVVEESADDGECFGVGLAGGGEVVFGFSDVADVVSETKRSRSACGCCRSG